MNFRKIFQRIFSSKVGVLLVLLFFFSPVSAQIFIAEGSILTVTSGAIVSQDSVGHEQKSNFKIADKEGTIGKIYISKGAVLYNTSDLTAELVYTEQNNNKKVVAVKVPPKEVPKEVAIALKKKQPELIIEKIPVFFKSHQTDSFHSADTRRSVGIAGTSNFSAKKLIKILADFNKDKFTTHLQDILVIEEHLVLNITERHHHSLNSRGPPAI